MSKMPDKYKADPWLDKAVYLGGEQIKLDVPWRGSRDVSMLKVRSRV